MNKGRFYNYIQPLYPIADIFFLKRKKQLARLINALPAGNVLEIGVGNGSMLPLYRKHIITGIDLSSKMLEMAKRRKTQARIHLFMADGEEMHFQEEHFDYVVINHVLSVTDDPERMLQEAFRVLKPDGNLFILNHFTPDNALQYADKMIQPFAYMLGFRSYFKKDALRALQQFQLLRQIASKPFGYFKILVLKK